MAMGVAPKLDKAPIQIPSSDSETWVMPTGCMETGWQACHPMRAQASNSVLMRCAGVLLLQASAQPYFAEKRGDGEVK